MTANFKQTTSLDEAKKLYLTLAKQYHPDKTGGDDALFKQLVTTYASTQARIKRDSPSHSHAAEDLRRERAERWEEHRRRRNAWWKDAEKQARDEPAAKKPRFERTPEEPKSSKTPETEAKTDTSSSPKCARYTNKGEPCKRTGKMTPVDGKNICAFHWREYTAQWIQRKRFVQNVEASGLDYLESTQLKVGDNITQDGKTVGFITSVQANKAYWVPYKVTRENMAWEKGNVLKIFTK